MRDLIAKGFLKYIIFLLGLTAFLSGGVMASFADNEGSHNAGMNCLNTGCHAGGEHHFFVGGTIYSDPNGTEARVGAQVTVIGANNQKTVLTSDQLGNFYLQTSIQAPFTISASYLGREVKMPANAPHGGCNDSGCHVAGNSFYHHHRS